jgi:tetrahydromethanopterin S-methyltransferase subunit C
MKSLTEWVQLAALVLIGGGGLSFLAVQLVKQNKWPSYVKLILSLVMAAIFGLLTAWLNADVWHIVTAWGSLTASDMLTFGAFVWAASTGWYMLVFKNATWAVHLGEWPKKV